MGLICKQFLTSEKGGITIFRCNCIITIFHHQQQLNKQTIMCHFFWSENKSHFALVSFNTCAPADGAPPLNPLLPHYVHTLVVILHCLSGFHLGMPLVLLSNLCTSYLQVNVNVYSMANGPEGTGDRSTHRISAQDIYVPYMYETLIHTGGHIYSVRSYL